MICHCLVLRLPCKEIAPVTMCTERGRCHFRPGWLVACYHQCGSETWPNLAMPLFHFRLQANDRIYRLVPAPHNSVWHAWVFQWVYAPSKLAAFCPKSNVRKHQTSSNIINHHQPSSTIINHHQPSISWTIHNFYKLRVHWFTPPLAISYHPNATMCHFQDPRGGLAAHHVRDQQLHFGPGLLVPGTGLFDRGEVPGKQISPGTSPWQPKMRVLVCEHAELIDHDLSNIYQIGFASFMVNRMINHAILGFPILRQPHIRRKDLGYGSKSAYFFADTCISHYFLYPWHVDPNWPTIRFTPKMKGY